MYTKYIPYAIIVCLGISILLSIKTCERNKNKIEDLQALDRYNKAEITQFKNKLDQVVTQDSVSFVNSDAIIKSLSDEVFDLKKRDEKRIVQVNALIRLAQKAGLKDTLFIPYTDTVLVHDSSLVRRDSVVIPPKDFRDSTKNYVVDGTVLLKGVRVNKITFPDTSSFRIAEQRPKGIFNRLTKPNITVVQSIHTNSLFETTGQQSIVVKHKQTFWQKIGKPVVVAVLAVIISDRLRR